MLKQNVTGKYDELIKQGGDIALFFANLNRVNKI